MVDYAIYTGAAVDLLLVEPGELGTGVHRCDQPTYLALNTVAGQVTAFSDEIMVPEAPVTSGPTFLAWCRERNLRLEDATSTEYGSQIAAHHYMPRCIYGRYLAWSAEELLRRAPPRMEISIATTAASAVRPVGEGAEVTLEDGGQRQVDLAIITSGHGLNEPAGQIGLEDGLIDRCYPLPEKIDGIEPGQRVALLGTGLTAIDVVSALTVGRGGRFHRSGAALRYEPSGQEPEIVLVNRRGWLPCARPFEPRRAPPSAMPLMGIVQTLRRHTAGGRIDFYSHLERELHGQMTARGLSPHEASALRRQLGIAGCEWECEDSFQAAVLDQARQDIAQSRLGLGGSRLKQLLETLRDQRETLRAVIDPPGMTAEGHRDFFSVVPALANRTAVGPQPERQEELLCLIDHGLVRLGPGPSPAVSRVKGSWELASTALRRTSRVQADVLVKAFLDLPELDHRVDPLIGSMRGWVALHPADARYINLDRNGHPFTNGGDICRALAVFGPPAEGASYYNNYVLWPGVWSRVLTDIDRVLKPHFGLVAQPTD